MIKLHRIIVESKPISTVINWSKEITLPGFEGVPLYNVVGFFFRQTQKIGLNDRAASIAFNFLMAIPPLLIFLFTVLAYFPESKILYEEILILIRNIVPDESTFMLIESVMDDFFAAGTGTLSIGLVMAIYFSSNATLTIMYTIRESMMHIKTENRNFIQIRLSAIRLTAIIMLLVMATIIIMLTQTIVLAWITEKLHIRDGFVDFIFKIGQFLITLSLIYLAIGLIYRFAPNIQRKWPIRTPGATLATLLIVAFTYLFSYWVNNFASYNKIYGSLGSILILMFLVFVNSLVLLIGFELNVSINSMKRISEKRKKKYE